MKRFLFPLFPLLLSAGCAVDHSPRAECRRQAYDDPTVKQMIMQQAGSPYLFQNDQTALHQAEAQATLHCLQARGIVPPGGVQPRAVTETHSLF